MDASEGATAPFPFASAAVRAGEAIVDVEWRQVPVGLLPEPTLDGAVAGRDLEQGEPILPSALRRDRAVPEGWWAVPLALPVTTAPGSAVLLVMLAPLRSVRGVAVRGGGEGAFGTPEAGLVAIPEQDAVNVAASAARGELTVLVEP